jgi:hypothetical protein
MVAVGRVRVVAACGVPLMFRGRAQGAASVEVRGQGVGHVAEGLGTQLPGWRCGELCGAAAVRYAVLSANGPLELPWAGGVGRPKRLVRRLGHDKNDSGQEEHSPAGGERGRSRLSRAWLVFQCTVSEVCATWATSGYLQAARAHLQLSVWHSLGSYVGFGFTIGEVVAD